MRGTPDVLLQLKNAGLTDYILLAVTHPTLDGIVRGQIKPEAVQALAADPRFASGLLYQLHKDVGNDLCEFRSHPGELGKGSLQIVIDKKTGDFYADIDKHSPYTDVVNILGHSFGEVVPNWLKKIFRRRKK